MTHIYKVSRTCSYAARTSFLHCQITGGASRGSRLDRSSGGRCLFDMSKKVSFECLVAVARNVIPLAVKNKLLFCHGINTAWQQGGDRSSRLQCLLNWHCWRSQGSRSSWQNSSSAHGAIAARHKGRSRKCAAYHTVGVAPQKHPAINTRLKWRCRVTTVGRSDRFGMVHTWPSCRHTTGHIDMHASYVVQIALCVLQTLWRLTDELSSASGACLLWQSCCDCSETMLDKVCVCCAAALSAPLQAASHAACLYDADRCLLYSRLRSFILFLATHTGQRVNECAAWQMKFERQEPERQVS